MPTKQPSHSAEWVEIRKKTDFQIIGSWVEPDSKVLDLGCGEGSLLAYLKKEKNVFGVGVDSDINRIVDCIGKGVSAFQGDIKNVLSEFEDDSFDRIIFSRTVEYLSEPGPIIEESLRVAKSSTIGFINHGFWINRLNYLVKGNRTINSVYPYPWHESRRSNPFSISEFEEFCQENNIRIQKRFCLASDWVSEQTLLPNLLAGYVIYDISR